MLKNTNQSYGAIAKILHWAMALIILALLSVGFFMTAMAFSPQKLQIYGLHKSFGMVVLFLFGVRVLWKACTYTPSHLDSHARWERALAKFIHVLLYVGMIGMPLSGWVMSSAGDFPHIFFGLFEVPALTGKNEVLFELMRRVHTLTAYALIGAVVLHMAGAFKHHFIDGDKTLERMTHKRLGFLGYAALAILAGGFVASPVLIKVQNFQAKSAEVSLSQATESVIKPTHSGWQINADKSYIKFEATQYDEPFEGAFESFSGEIEFDPQNLGEAHVRIEIDIASIKTGSEDRDEQARGSEWFDTSLYPKAVFEADKFLVRKPNHTNPNHYEARGYLELRGVQLPVILPFSLTIEEDGDVAQKALMDAQIQLNRLDFGVGQGPWKSAETIGNRVIIEVHVEAMQTRGL